MVTVTGTGACACGRTTWRFRVTGRTDDMFNVRGVNVFPTAVQRGVAEPPDIASGQFRIVLDGPGPIRPHRRAGGSRAAALPREPMRGRPRELEQRHPRPCRRVGRSHPARLRDACRARTARRALIERNDHDASSLSNGTEPVGVVTLNRPERLNAISGALTRDLDAALAQANADDRRSRAIVLTGAGRAFCAGDDLKEFDRADASPERSSAMSTASRRSPGL